MSQLKYLISREKIVLLPLDGRDRVVIPATDSAYTTVAGLLKLGDLAAVSTLYIIGPVPKRPTIDTSKSGNAAWNQSANASVLSQFAANSGGGRSQFVPLDNSVPPSFSLTSQPVGAPVGQKYTRAQILEVRSLLQTVGNLHTIAKMTKMSRRHIARIRQGKVHANIV